MRDVSEPDAHSAHSPHNIPEFPFHMCIVLAVNSVFVLPLASGQLLLNSLSANRFHSPTRF